ncbi:hypothetical protein [Chelativorans sp.]|uniref:hypothetical protein n=1 Tax=Chelativorans sp. TaxID=2203393 RepID=UPI002811FC81|nr:hypothetical protein [Chelativorans sp.]
MRKREADPQGLPCLETAFPVQSSMADAKPGLLIPVVMQKSKIFNAFSNACSATLGRWKRIDGWGW